MISGFTSSLLFYFLITKSEFLKIATVSYYIWVQLWVTFFWLGMWVAYSEYLHIWEIFPLFSHMNSILSRNLGFSKISFQNSLWISPMSSNILCHRRGVSVLPGPCLLCKRIYWISPFSHWAPQNELVDSAI